MKKHVIHISYGLVDKLSSNISFVKMWTGSVQDGLQ